MRLRRPRCRCPAGADAEAAAEDAAGEAGTRTRAQHFSLCPAPGLWERARNNSTSLSPTLAQAKTPFLSSRLPRSPSPPFSRSYFTAARGKPNFCPGFASAQWLLFSPRRSRQVLAGWCGLLFAEAGTREGNGNIRRRGSHLSFSRCHRPKPQHLRRTPVLGPRCKKAPALAQAMRRVGSDWVALRDREQPPDAATAPLRALAPEASTRAFNTLRNLTIWSRSQMEYESRAGTRNGPAPQAGFGARGAGEGGWLLHNLWRASPGLLSTVEQEA